MFLLEYNELGELDKITPNAPYGLVGFYVSELPASIEVLLAQGTIEQLETEEHKIYYKIKEI